MIANTFIIGAMKSATTGLCDILGQHPQATFSCPKEPDFFSRDEVYAKGLGWYQTLFPKSGSPLVIGEGSTSYTKQLQFPRAAERLAKHAPNAKLIYMARNPIQRMQSHWSHEVLKGRTRLSMEDFVRTHSEAVDISCYWKQINRYRDYFPDEQIRVLFFEDYCKSAQRTVDQCCEFLGLPNLSIVDLNIDRNQTSSRRKDIAPIRMLRRYRWFDVQFERSKQGIPKPLQVLLKRALKSRSGVAKTSWNPGLLHWAQDQVAEDSHQFLNAFGKPLDFWKDSNPDSQAADAVVAST